MKDAQVLMDLLKKLKELSKKKLEKDDLALKKCRQILPIIRKKLESSFKGILNQSRSVAVDVKNIEDIEELLEQLKIDYLDLLIKLPGFTDAIDKSLKRIRLMQKDPSASCNKPSYVLIDIGEYWGAFNIDNPTTTNISEAQDLFFNKGLLGRFLYRIRCWYHSCKNNLMICTCMHEKDKNMVNETISYHPYAPIEESARNIIEILHKEKSTSYRLLDSGKSFDVLIDEIMQQAMLLNEKCLRHRNKAVELYSSDSSKSYTIEIKSEDCCSYIKK